MTMMVIYEGLRALYSSQCFIEGCLFVFIRKLLQTTLAHPFF